MTIDSIGVIGLGAIGRPMCRHLAAAGYRVTGYDPNEEACERTRRESGVETLATPGAAAARSQFVIVVVGFEKQVEDVIFAGDGLLAGARPGMILGISSTVSPGYAHDLAQRLERHDLTLLDMPTTRSWQAAEDGTMLILGGGDERAFEACRPVFETFAVATDIFNLGPFGSGQVAKMANNMILWACMAANDEALRLGEQFGLGQEDLRAALVRSSAANFPLIERSDTRPIPWAEKDLAIARDEAEKLRFPLPLTAHVSELIQDFKRRHGYATPTLPAD